MAPKKLYFGTNLKMYKTNRQTEEYLTELVHLSGHVDRSRTELFVIPSFTALAPAVPIGRQGGVRIGAQNMHWAECGQYTGEISPLMLKELGVELVELGHSERRHVFGEDDELIRKKTHSALLHGFTTLLCVGETGREKAEGLAEQRLVTQLESALSGVTLPGPDALWVAYEPVWAIGTEGTPADPAYVGQQVRRIRDTLCGLFPGMGEDVPILYGGSVDLDNGPDYIRLPEVNGLFVGRCAWEARRFLILIDKICSKC